MGDDPSNQAGGPASRKASFDLSSTQSLRAHRPPVVSADGPVGYLMLRRNAVWFTKLRWVVVAAFVLFALLGMSGWAKAMRINLASGWLLTLAGVLAVLNVGYVWHCSRLGTDSLRPVKANLWCQIACDLVALSVVVHMVGSYDTFAPFLFMIHITLACIFLSRRSSLIVVLIASALYGGVVVCEQVGVLQKQWVFAGMRHGGIPSEALAVHVGSAILLWLVIWVLVAELAAKLRQRQREVLQAQERTMRTFKEAQDHMRYTSHQMKAPLDAIRSNVSLMRQGYAGELSGKSQELLERIEARCDALSAFVGDVLHLAHLKSGDELSAAREHLRLDQLIGEVVDALKAKASGRQVSVEVKLMAMTVWGDREALAMLVDNLLTNAINYSHEGGTVRVNGWLNKQGGAVVRIADEGIGIPEDKLEKVFDEYYRTNEAKRHNPHSTGVGLAIVREVAASHHVQVRVESQVGVGTAFELAFPAA